MGLELPYLPIGFVGRVVDGEHANLPVRLIGDSRVTATGRHLVVLDGTPSGVSIGDLSEVEQVIGGSVEWPGFAARAIEAVDMVRSWFGASEMVTVEEPFVSGMFNSTPVRLLSSAAEEASLTLEFDAMWDVVFDELHVIDASSDALTLLAAHTELSLRRPTITSSTARMERVPFRWIRT